MSSKINVETSQEIIREVLPLKDQRRVDTTAFVNLVTRLGITDCEPKIYFLRELAAIIRELPIKVFASPDDRLRLVEGIQDALDVAIEEEEDMAFEEALP